MGMAGRTRSHRTPLHSDRPEFIESKRDAEQTGSDSDQESIGSDSEIDEMASATVDLILSSASVSRLSNSQRKSQSTQAKNRPRLRSPTSREFGQCSSATYSPAPNITNTNRNDGSDSESNSDSDPDTIPTITMPGEKTIPMSIEFESPLGSSGAGVGLPSKQTWSTDVFSSGGCDYLSLAKESHPPKHKANDMNEESMPKTKPGAKTSASGKKSFELSSSLKLSQDIKGYLNVDAFHNPQQQKINIVDRHNSPKELEVLKKSVITADFEKRDKVPVFEESKRQAKLQRQKERERTKGINWFHLPATEMTDEKKHDLEVLRMRRVLDPKRFYKNNDSEVLPKYFQMGKVLESPADFYHARVPKKERKANIVEELLADAAFRQYNKRKYAEIQEKTMAKSRGAFKHAKRLKKKKR